MDEQCMECGHEWDIHHLRNGICPVCIEDEEYNNEQFEEIVKGQELFIANVSKTK